jgi:hypothetical protein
LKSRRGNGDARKGSRWRRKTKGGGGNIASKIKITNVKRRNNFRIKADPRTRRDNSKRKFMRR